MAAGLFRREALDFNREKSLGEVVLVRPLSFSVLTALAVSIAITVIAYAWLGQYTRKAHVTGYLAPSMGLIKVYAPEAGTLVEKHVSEGQKVKQGDVLFVVSMERNSRTAPEAKAAAIAKLKERRESLKQELAKQVKIDAIQTRALEERIQGMNAELKQLNLEVATQQDRVASAVKMTKRYQDLVASKFISEAAAQQKNDEVLDQQSKLQNLGRGRIALERELNSARQELSSAGLRAVNQRATIERSISALEQELTEHESRRTAVVTAPTDGTATTILAERGQVANTSTPLLSILPAGAELRAELLVPSKAIGFIAPEQTVAVRYSAFPYQRFGSYGGRVKEISRTLITPGEANLPIQLQEPVYRVTVGLDSQFVKAYSESMPLQSGMLLEADVSLDRHRIIQWIFDPLYSVTGKI